MLETVLALLLGVHLLLVDVAMIGPLGAACLDWLGRRTGDPLAEQVGLRLARLSIWALTLGIVLGILLLGARWHTDDGQYFRALAVLPRSRLWFAGFELLFYFACMGSYSALWNRWRRWRAAHRLLAVAAATNLLMHFPALFVIVSVLIQRGEFAAPMESAEFRRLLIDGEVLSRVVHVWLSAVAVTAVVLMLLLARRIVAESQLSSAQRIVRGAAAVALAAALVQVLVGFWVTMELPEAARRPLLGGDVLATSLFVASIGLSLALMHQLASIALGDVDARPIRRCAWTLGLLVLLMVGTRSRAQHASPWARDAALSPAAVAQLWTPTEKSTTLAADEWLPETFAFDTLP